MQWKVCTASLTLMVFFNRSPPRTRRSSASSSSSGHGGKDSFYPNPTVNRSRSPTPKLDLKNGLHPQKYVSSFLLENGRGDSVSPKRERSTSPRGMNRPSYNTPTMASRNRSRSPSVNSPEHQKKKNSEVYSKARQHDVKFLTATNLNGSESEYARRARVTLEAMEPTNNDDGKQNDSGSEVSDEGYRSLGLVVSSPLVGEGKVVANNNNTHKNGHGNLIVGDSELRGSYLILI